MVTLSHGRPPSSDALSPEPPFVWPEPRVLEGLRAYENQPPTRELVRRSRSVFGTVTALADSGVSELEDWLRSNPTLRISLILQVYPACATEQSDLARLIEIVRDASERLHLRILPLERVSDRGTNALCFVGFEPDHICLAIGPTENLGLATPHVEHLNLVFRADPSLVESFRRSFDYWWVKARDIVLPGVACIPALALPKGTDEAARSWRSYVDQCVAATVADGSVTEVARVDPVAGEVTLVSATQQPVASPTEELGLPKADPLAERVARLYSKGMLVSVDKLSRIPPLDAPLDPSTFGDASEIQKGNVTRKVSMRVSVIDEKTLKDIDRRRQGLRGLLTKFTFALADNMRWMPSTARQLFESELNRMNEEGQRLISDLLKGDVAAFVNGKRPGLVADINAMHAELGRPGTVTDDVISRIVGGLQERLTKATSANFMPKLAYSDIGFVRTNSGLVSPWGQALSLLMDAAAFPRKALTDRFFFSGLKVSEDDLIEAMNVTDDALCRDLRARGVKERCRAELDLLGRIESASIDMRDRCELTYRILDGDSTDAVDAALTNKEPA